MPPLELILLASAADTSRTDAAPIPAVAIPSPMRLATLPNTERKIASVASAVSVTAKLFVTSTDSPSW